MENSTGLVIIPNDQPTWFSLSHAAFFLVAVLFCLSGCVGGGKEFHLGVNTFSDRQYMLLFLVESHMRSHFIRWGAQPPHISERSMPPGLSSHQAILSALRLKSEVTMFIY